MKLLAVLSSFGLPILAGAAGSSPTVTLDAGPIVGVATQLPGAAAPVNKFLGIPYADPPERFSRAKKPKAWKSPKKSTEYGPSCPQLFVDTGIGPEKDLLENFFNDDPPESDDCLYMNAFVPSTPQPEGGRPVVLFIHGGGWQQGHGRADMSGFAAYEDIIVFMFNWRTNIFGFPSSPDLKPSEVNLGLYDQRLALEWAQSNAKAFGGDPQKVTIWGQSAGSMSVDVHVTAYGDDASSAPPFRGAIMSSGQLSIGMLGLTGGPRNTQYFEAVGKALGCGDAKTQLSCMRKASKEDVVAAMEKTGATFMPVVDNVTVLSHRAERWRDGKAAKVPILMGTVAEEGRALVNRHINISAFQEAYLPEPLVNKTQLDGIFEAYRADAHLKSDFDVAAELYTEYFWQFPQGMLANISAAVGNPTWRYFFNTSVTSMFPKEYSWLGKFHGTEVSLLFTTPTFEGNSSGVPLTPQLHALGHYFRGVIGRFVRNPEGGPGWPAVGSKYSPFDVVNIGDVGDCANVAGPTPVDRNVLDKRFGLFEDLYPLIEQFLLG